ncbi:MAG: proline iminopeptidase-family hydrolase [Flavisolibacter sp.]
MNKCLAFFLLVFCSCAQNEKPAEKKDKISLEAYHATKEGEVQTGGVKMIPIESPLGKFEVWTKKFGNNPRVKVLLLHGGPAGTHEGFECFESFFPKEGFEFYEYDQLGSYYSQQPTDSSLWTIERFVDEVEQVRKSLGLDSSNFILLGHSWGGILAMEYALKYQQRLKGLVISNMMASAPDYGKYSEKLAAGMNPAALEEIRLLESRKDFANPRYMELLVPHFYNKHVMRLKQWPEPVNRMFKHLNPAIYTLMQGPSEFGISGRLALWDRKADLPKLTLPVLTIGGAHDTMDPEHMKWMSTQVGNGQYLHCAEGSHMAMWDDQQTYMNGLIKWIREVDSKQ